MVQLVVNSLTKENDPIGRNGLTKKKNVQLLKMVQSVLIIILDKMVQLFTMVSLDKMLDKTYQQHFLLYCIYHLSNIEKMSGSHFDTILDQSEHVQLYNHQSIYNK